MMTFTYERSSLDYMLESNKHSFTVKDKDEFILYSQDENGEPCHFLKEHMGEYSDGLLLEFLCGMDDIYKYMFSSSDEYLNRIIYIMIMFIDINYDDLKNGGFSYCSHVNGYLSFFRERQKAEMMFEKEYQKNKSSLILCFEDYKLHKSQNSRIYRILKENIECISQKADDGLRNGMIHFIKAEERETNLSSSKFHNLLFAKTDFIKKLETDEVFRRRRFMTICFYTFLKNAGIDLKKRCYISYMIYRSLEDILSFSYKELLS